jgi:hypothetical protein
VLYLQGKEDSEVLIQDSIRILEVHHYIYLKIAVTVGIFFVLALILTVKFCWTV